MTVAGGHKLYLFLGEAILCCILPDHQYIYCMMSQGLTLKEGHLRVNQPYTHQSIDTHLLTHLSHLETCLNPLACILTNTWQGPTSCG